MAKGPGLNLRIDRLALDGRAPLFAGFRLQVPPGQVLALIGPSGIGKTTLLRTLSGAERRWQGKVEVDGLPPNQAPMPGYVFQDARLLPWLTAEGNLRAVAPDLTNDHITELLRQVGLAGQKSAWPHALSGGMQRRLALARALAVQPGLLLLDEPFVSLDRTIIRELQTLFLKVFSEREPTVVMVSHDPEDAARIADRAVVLGGRPARIIADITLQGTPGQRSPETIARLAAELSEAGVPAGAIP